MEEVKKIMLHNRWKWEEEKEGPRLEAVLNHPSSRIPMN